MKAEEVIELIENLDNEERWKVLELMYDKYYNIVQSKEFIKENKMDAEDVIELIQNLDSEKRWRVLEKMYVVPSQESLEENKYKGAGFGLVLQEFKKALSDTEKLKKEFAKMEMKVNRLEKEQEKKELGEV